MLFNNYNSDHGYGSGSSLSSCVSQQDLRRPLQTLGSHTHKFSSYSDLVPGRCSREDVMREFRMNGSDDAPYDPDEEGAPGWGKHAAPSEMLLSGMGPASAYLRQQSWPAPERSPAAPLPRPQPTPFATSTPIFDEVPAYSPLPPPPRAAPAPPPPGLTAAQARALASLPADVVDFLLRQLQQVKRSRVFQECRFCKNNGERESYYRTHVLKDGAGRVACPVLRAFRCQRCGASGDHAHTIKYCPLSTNEERIKSAGMMRSVRVSTERRRAQALPSMSMERDYVMFGQLTPSVLRDNSAISEPLDPLWAALEQKLLL